jgi:hypothetical protein
MVFFESHSSNRVEGPFAATGGGGEREALDGGSGGLRSDEKFEDENFEKENVLEDYSDFDEDPESDIGSPMIDQV